MLPQYIVWMELPVVMAVNQTVEQYTQTKKGEPYELTNLFDFKDTFIPNEFRVYLLP